MENEPVQLQTGTSITPEHVFLIRSMFLSGISVLASGHCTLPKRKFMMKLYKSNTTINYNYKKVKLSVKWFLVLLCTIQWSGLGRNISQLPLQPFVDLDAETTGRSDQEAV